MRSFARVKVFLLVYNLAPLGGVERSLVELAPALRHAGTDCTVVALRRDDPGLEETLVARGVPVRVVGGNRRRSQVRRLRALLAEERPELLHTMTAPANLVGAFAAAGFRTRVLASVVVDDPERPRRRRIWSHALDSIAHRLLIDHFHAVGDAEREAALREHRCRPSRVTTARRGRDPALLGEPGRERRREGRRRLGLSDEVPVVLNVAAEAPRKDQVTLLTAFEKLCTRRHDAVLLVAGARGAASDALDEIEQRSPCGARIRRLGARDDVPDLLAAVDVFAFPSRWEGLAGALIEAGAMALPIVASDTASNREIVESGVTGLLVPVGDPDAFASAIEQLIDDRALAARLGGAARRQHQSEYLPEHATRRMLDLYEKVVAPRR
jgi:glycosyltransferase involved in cell wall biosynthesis